MKFKKLRFKWFEFVLEIAIVCLVFVLGLLSANLINFSFSTEKPFGYFISKESPHNWISEDNIKIYKDKVVIYVKDAVMSRYAPTGSMTPTLDAGANGIEIKPKVPEQIHVGDIIAYRSKNDLIVHRVVFIGQDAQGWYCITKGDNSPQLDNKVRFNQIEQVTIAIIY